MVKIKLIRLSFVHKGQKASDKSRQIMIRANSNKDSFSNNTFLFAFNMISFSKRDPLSLMIRILG